MVATVTPHDGEGAAMGDAVLEGYEPTAQQLRMWRAAGGLESTVEAMVRVRVTGRPDGDRLAAAVAAVAARQEILRTRLRGVRGLAVPVAVIGDEPVFATRVDGGGAATVLTLTAPAYCWDAWSADLLCRELAVAYDNRLDAAEPPLQHADAAAWLQEIIQDPAAESGREYWREAAGDQGGVRLPYRSGAGGGTGSVPVAVDADTQSGLRRLADGDGRSLTGVLLACWAGALGRIAGRDVTVGVAADGRNYPDLAGAVGPYARYLPARVAVLDRPSLAVAATSATARLAAHAELQEYAAWPQGEGPSGAGAPPVAFALDVVEAGPAHQADGVSFELAGWYALLDRTEVRLTVAVLPRALSVALEYDAARYAGADMACLAEQLGALLAHAARDARGPVSALSMLSAQQAQQAQQARLLGGRPVSAAVPVADPPHRLIAAVADREPGRVAVRAGEDELSYAELDGRARQLARRLAGRGVRVGDAVGVCVPAGIECAVAQLAVLEAGATALLLDPARPRARLRDAFRSVAPVATVTLAAYADAFEGAVAEPVLLAPGAAPAADGADAEVAGANGTEVTGAAFLLPAGDDRVAVLDHADLAGTVGALLDRLAPGPGDRLLAATGPAMPDSLPVVLTALAAGATVVCPPRLDPDALAELVDRESVTIWTSGTDLFLSVVARLRRSGRTGECLRLVVLTGRVPLAVEAERVRAVLPGIQLEYLYGAAEAPGHAAASSADLDPAWLALPIGEPLGGHRRYVVDEELRLCPVGVPGRVAIAGSGGGYVGRPRATARAFVPDPFGVRPGGRLFLTGDAGRLRPDGSVELIGRFGEAGRYPGSPAEVSAQLLAHPSVEQAVTVPAADGDGPGLVSYVTGDATAAHLRTYLADRLPAARLPSAVVVLPALPLDADGVVDREALAVPAGPVVDHVEPRNPLEEELVAICAEFLRAPRIGMLDNFFRLGGHSLQLAQLSGRITEHFGVEIALQQLFEADTLEKMAHLILETQLATVDDAGLAELVADLDTGTTGTTTGKDDT
jgi:non-ribosomal peptide synthetase component F/acyl carrier protein